MKTLNAEQALQFLNMTQSTRYYALFHLAISTGLRQGELLGLQWSDINWLKASLKIQRQLQRISGEGLVFNEPKSASGKREIVLGPSTISILQSHRIQQSVEMSFDGGQWKDMDLVFSTRIVTPIEPRNILRIFKKLLKNAELPNIRFHDLRHTAATLMLQEGIHPKVVQERLGHSQISLTLDTYSHVLPGMQKDAAIALDELLAPIPVEIEPA